MSLAHLSIRRTTTNGPITVDKSFAGGDRYVGQWKEGLVRLLRMPQMRLCALLSKL